MIRFNISKTKEGYKLTVTGGVGLCTVPNIEKARLFKKFFERHCDDSIMQKLMMFNPMVR